MKRSESFLAPQINPALLYKFSGLRFTSPRFTSPVQCTQMLLHLILPIHFFYFLDRLTNSCLFIIREVNSDMPIYILTEQMSEKKIKCPERDSNPRHPDLMEGALTTELPRQPQWSESNIHVSCKTFVSI